MAIRNCDYEKWVHSNSIRHEEEEDQDQDEEEALSLCDLPTSCEGNSRKDQPAAAAQETKPQDHQDFDFGSWTHTAEICAADDVFFKGRILPLRHSISSDSGLTTSRGADSAGANISGGGIARCASMDHCTSGGRFMTTNASSTSSSSRSSSVRSHNSASSGSTSTTTTTSLPPKVYKPKIRNQFHSHPSPSPQLRTPSNRQGNNYTAHPNRKSSTMWRFFQVGLLRTPEIELTGLKIRSKNNSTVHAYGSRNSSTSSSSSVSNAAGESKNKGTENISKKVHGGLFGSGCKCSVDTVPLNNFVKNDFSRGDHQTKEGLLGGKKKKKMKDDDHERKQGGKQAMSRHRTFEWLKQLSLQEGAAA